MLGGVLPDWLSGQTTFADLSAKQAGLLAGCAIAAVSLLPGLRIRGLTKATAESGRYPRSPFIRRFLPVVFLWSLPTGAFNPFFNVYFARYLELSTPQIWTFILGWPACSGRCCAVGSLVACADRPGLRDRCGTNSGWHWSAPDGISGTVVAALRRLPRLHVVPVDE